MFRRSAGKLQSADFGVWVSVVAFGTMCFIAWVSFFFYSTDVGLQAVSTDSCDLYFTVVDHLNVLDGENQLQIN